MTTPRAIDRNDPPPASGRFVWRDLAIWLVAPPALGALAAWAAVGAESYFAWLLFPILVGVGLGAMLIALMRLSQSGHRPTIVLGTILAAVVATVGQHYLPYLDARQQAHRENETIQKARQAFPEQFRAENRDEGGFLDYMRHQARKGRPLFGKVVATGPHAVATWALDGLLLLAAALLLVVPTARLPYCNACRSWYRTIRVGKLPASAALRVAEIAELPLSETARSVRYRLSACHGGCSPTRFELSWEEADREHYLARMWLDSDGRNLVVQMLDEAGQRSEVGGRRSEGE